MFGALVRWAGALLLVALAAGAADAQSAPPTRKSITVAIATDFPPHSAVEAQGQPQGMRPEMWRLWSQATGIAVNFVTVPWGKTLELVMEGRADVADPVVFRQDRAERLELSATPFFDATVHAFFNANLSGINGVESLRGFAVAVSRQGACRDWLAEHGIANLRDYPDLESMVQGVVNHEAEVFCTGRITGFTYLAKAGMIDRFHYTAPLYTAHFHWAVRKGDTALRDQIQDGFDRIPAAEVDAVRQRWLGNFPDQPVAPERVRQAVMVAAGTLVVLVVLLGWNRLLHRRVAEAVADQKEVSLHLEALLANLPGVVYRMRVLPTRRELSYLSDGFERQYGLPAARCMSLSTAEWLEMVHPDDRAIFGTRWDKLDGFGELVMRFRFLRPDGQLRWFEAHERVVERQGDTLFAEGLVLDVTEEEETRAALRQREDLFAAIAAQAPSGIVLIDCETLRFVEFNDAACAGLGYSREEFARLSLPDIADVSADHIDQRNREIAATGSSILESRHRRRDGSVQEVQANVGRIDIAGKPHFAAIWTDIGERRRMEKALAVRELEFRTLAENSPDNIIRYDTDCRIAYANRNYKATVDESRPRLMGPVEAAPEGAPQVRAYQDLLRRVLRTGEPGEAELALFNPAGEPRTHHVRLVAERDGQGNITGALGFGRDITARRRMEDALAAREREFHSLAENAPIHIVRYDPEGRVLYLNQRVVRTMGTFSQGDPIGKTPSQSCTDFDFTAYEAAIRHVAASGESALFEMEFPADGGARVHSIHLTAERDGDGAVTSVLAIGRDITESRRLDELLRTREQEFRTLAENSPDPIYRYDRDCRRLYVNPVVGRILGRPVEELIGATPDDGSVLASPQSRRLMAALRAVFAGGETGRIDVDYTDGDGLRRNYSMLLVPEFDAGGQVATVLALARDMTEHKRQEEALRRSEAGLKEAQRIARLGNWELDLTTRALIWSDEIFRIFEIDPGKFGASYEAFLDAIHPDDRTLVDHAYTESVASRVPYDIVHRLRMTDGRIKYVNERCETFYDDQDRPIRSVGTVQDITRQKRVELELEAERQRFEDLVSVLPVGVFETLPDGGNSYTNDCWLKFAGRTQQDIGGFGWADVIHPDDAERVRAQWADALPRRAPVTQECRLVTPDGQVTWVHTVGVPRFAADGAFLGYVGVSLDITRQRALEQELWEYGRRFETLVDNLPGMVLRGFLGPDGRFDLLYLSRGSEKMIGISAADWVAKSAEEQLATVHPADRPLLAQGLAELMTGDRSRFRIRAAHADGHIVHEDYWLTAIERRDGGVVYEGLVLDVSEEMTLMGELDRQLDERRRLEQQIQEARKLESLGRLAGGIAHDFNNIMGAILGFAQFVAEDTPPDHPAHGHAQRILSASQRGKKLVEQILIFARRAKAERSLFAMPDLVSECEPLLHIAIPSSIRITVDIRSSGAVVEASRDQLGQVLMNLCFNARDALEGRNGAVTIGVDVLPTGHPLVECAAAGPPGGSDDAGVWSEDDGSFAAMVGRCQSGVACVAMSVKDDGSGIPVAALSKIFDPFFTTKDVGKGTGLGLSVVQGIVMEHGGAIIVHSRPGEGCEFVVLLPLAEAVAEAAVPALQTALPPATAGRVLIVDDDHDFGDMLAVMLERRGWSVLCQSSPQAGLQALAAEPAAWTVVVTDQVMPDMRGQDLIARVKAIRPDLPCILCTGYDGTLDEEQARQFGATTMLRKPFEPEALVAAIVAASEPAPSGPRYSRRRGDRPPAQP